MYIILYIDYFYSLCDFDLVFKLDDSTKYTIKLPRVYSVNVLKLLSFQNSDETTSKITPLLGLTSWT